MKKKIYIAGAGGMLGQAFYERFRHNYSLFCTDIDTNEPWLKYCDMRHVDVTEAEILSFSPDYIFHLGALTDLEMCEGNKPSAYWTNTAAVKTSARMADYLDVPLLYIGTAGMFDGKQEAYDDDARPSPIGAYARSKAGGEYIAATARRHLICRAGWMMGGGPKKDKKFVGKIMQQLKAQKTELFIVADKTGTPTYTHDFAANVQLLLDKGIGGINNMVCEGHTSRLEVAYEILCIFGLQDKVKITPVPSDYFSKECPVERPASECLVNRCLKSLKLNIMRNWKVCLKEYLEQDWKDYL